MSAPSAARFVGTSVQRREDPRLLRGEGRYVADVAVPGMLHAAFVRSPLAAATIARIDVQAARAHPGVVAVWTGPDLNDEVGRLWDHGAEDAPYPAVKPLAHGDVRFVGDPVAVVVAESRYIAEDACELVDVEYEPRDAVIGRELALDTAAVVHAEIGTNLGWSGGSGPDPELDAALAGSEHVFTETFHQQRQTNVPMETRGIVASWSSGARELTVWTASQNPHQDRLILSSAHGLAENAVRVIMADVGGGFGQKIFKGRDEHCVVVCSRRLGLPVKWIEDRQENLIASNHARDEQITVTMGVDADGVIQAVRADYLGDLGAYPQLPPPAIASICMDVFPGPYRIAHYGWSARTVFTNTCGLAAYRGPWMMETVAREMMMDVVARKLGIDPADIRRRNIISSDDLPYTTATGSVYERVTPAETFEAALDAIGYDEVRATQEAMSAEGRLLGIGLSTYVEPTGFPGGGMMGNEVATIRVEPTGAVNVLMGVASHGHSLETTMVQVVADQLGIPMEGVTLRQGDTATAPAGGGTVGSRSAVIGGGAARVSAAKLREKVVAIAAHLLEAAPSDLEIENGVIFVRGDPESAVTFVQVAEAAYLNTTALPPGMEPGLENTSRFVPTAPTFANSTQICLCEVDPATGEVSLLDYVVGEDCGVMINPMVVDGQIAGGVAQGIGGVLLEEMAYSDVGDPRNITFKDYLVPTIADVPDIRYAHVQTPSASEGGFKGVGEGGTIGAPAAVVNAIADALAPLGVHITSQPLGPDRVLALIEAAAADRS